MIKGIVTVYCKDASAGIIQSEDQTPYYFLLSQWLPRDITPEKDTPVTFEHSASGAKNVRLAE